MTWTPSIPDGSISVKANRPNLTGNTNYIQATLGNQALGTNTGPPNTAMDHFWNIAPYSGRHRFVQMPAFVDGVGPTDPKFGASMDGIIYLKTTNGTVQPFYRNSGTIYQAVPTVKTGTVAIPNNTNYVTITSVPDGTYGNILLYRPLFTGELSVTTGTFVATAGVVNGWSEIFLINTSDTLTTALKLGNGSNASGLDLRARKFDGSNATYSFILTYRSL